jgi:hypothetical protein
MRKLSLVEAGLSDAVAGWTKVSDHVYAHPSGARIERRGYPDPQGWYLRSPMNVLPVERFDPTPAGCDAAFVSFAGQRAVAAYLSRILKRAG